MSETGEHNGLRGKVEAFARNELVTGFNRLLIMLGAPLFGFLGLQVWGDIKDGQAEAKRDSEALRREIVELADKVGTMKTGQAVTEVKVQWLERRVDKLEGGQGTPPMQP